MIPSSMIQIREVRPPRLIESEFNSVTLGELAASPKLRTLWSVGGAWTGSVAPTNP